MHGEIRLRPSGSSQHDCLKFIGVNPLARLEPGQYEQIAQNVCAMYAVCATQAAFNDQLSRVANANKTKLASAAAALIASTVKFGAALTATHRVGMVANIGSLLADAAMQPAYKGTIARLEAGASILIDMLHWNSRHDGAGEADVEKRIVAQETGSIENEKQMKNIRSRLATTFAEVDEDKSGNIDEDEGLEWLKKKFIIPEHVLKGNVTRVWQAVWKKNSSGGDGIDKNGWEKTLHDLIECLKDDPVTRQIAQTVEDNVGGQHRHSSVKRYEYRGRHLYEAVESWDSEVADQIILSNRVVAIAMPRWRYKDSTKLRLKRLFETIDEDGSGEIDQEEGKEFLMNTCQLFKPEELEDYWEKLMEKDTNGDGKLDKDEFVNGFIATMGWGESQRVGSGNIGGHREQAPTTGSRDDQDWEAPGSNDR